MDKMDLAIAFQNLNDRMDCYVDKYRRLEMSSCDYYKTWWLELDSLVREYLKERPSTIESYIEGISHIRGICKTMSENSKDKSTGLYQGNGLLWYKVHFHLTRALMDLERIREHTMEVRYGQYAEKSN